MSRSAIEEVFEELGRIQHEPGEPSDLVQFRALATAHQYRTIYDAVLRYFRPGDELLDWGCGNGHVSWSLIRLGFGPLTAYSFEDFALRPRIPQDRFAFRLGDTSDAVTLPFPDQVFDGVLSIGVLEHVRETGGTEEGSLREIRRVLRPGGRFLCAHFPNRGSWIEFLSRRIPDKHSHTCLYGEADIRSLAQEAGLELLEQRRYGMLPRNAWGRLPDPIRGSRTAARVWDGLDHALERLVPALTQNHLWVARRPEA